MNVQKVVEELKRQYPGKNIILNPPENPTEVVCEIEPGSMTPERSTAIAVMDSNINHMHRQAIEVYEIIKGVLEVNKEGRTYVLQQGQKIVIKPGEVHTVKGKETWVKVTSTPAWSGDDQFNVGD